ncbi:hypothetical protein AB0D10_13265 [Kitasatospora sp. NPDC048545]|uniref:hypothetical protein n=1 Tax=Kitasatospora sp. NPDC048545 TaxID=3157208 RepID=UPI0033EC7B7D
MVVVIGAALIGLLVLVIFGCVCVVWADRGGPAWTRMVAALTVRAGEVVRSAQRNRRRRGSNGGGGGD